MTRRKILIVEDEVLVRCGLRSMVNWEKLGLRSEERRVGKEC